MTTHKLNRKQLRNIISETVEWSTFSRMSDRDLLKQSDITKSMIGKLRGDYADLMNGNDYDDELAAELYQEIRDDERHLRGIEAEIERRGL